MEQQINIQVDSNCKLHGLPRTHFCILTTCACTGQLCERCLTQHENQNQNSKLLSFQSYCNKISMESEIFQKQYTFLQTKKKAPEKQLTNVSQKFDQFSKTQVYVLENSMKFLNEETRMLFRQISQKQLQFTTAYEKINVQRKTAHQKFFKQVQSKSLVDYCIGLYNQSGWAKFKSKMSKMMDLKDSIINFLQKTQNYGKNSEQLLKVSSIKGQLSIRQSINQLMLNPNNSKKSSQNKSKDSQNSVQKRKRAKTIFGRN